MLSADEEGLTATEESPGMMVITTAALCFVTPFSVTFKKSAMIPAKIAAVKVGEELVEELRVPRLLVRVHE
jgi:NaMN:DMB phosphoribosyltransferase